MIKKILTVGFTFILGIVFGVEFVATGRFANTYNNIKEKVSEIVENFENKANDTQSENKDDEEINSNDYEYGTDEEENSND